MPAYIIANYDITDGDLFKEYVAAAGGHLKIGELAKLVALDSETEALEGSPGKQTVVLEYESAEAARDVWNSDGYQAIVGKRLEASKNHFAVLIEGL